MFKSFPPLQLTADNGAQQAKHVFYYLSFDPRNYDAN